jgi:3-phenylpropionate/trans-cinnamate dioxygenase ferredoxin reductase subunit
MSRQRIVIVGASLAGATAAAGLRSEGFADDVLLIGAESQLPYHRPPLSKEYLRGEQPVEDTLVNPARSYAETGIELRLGVRATTIEPRRKLVELEGGGRVAYDRLLVATGARNRTLSVPGAALDGIFQLRTVEDCDRIRAAAKPGRRAVLIGLGFIGSEVTASLRQLGVEVTAVDGQRAPLARVLGEEVGAVLAEIHRDKGAELLLEDGVAAFEGVGRVERVRTRKGRLLACDFVVAGIGVTPNTELLAAAGVEVNNGILVDERCRTSLPDVYAAGDVTNHHHPIFGRLRVEHWNNAYRQGLAAARSMVGGDQPYDYLHSHHRVRRLRGGLGPHRVQRPSPGPPIPRLLPEGWFGARGRRPRPRRRSGGPERRCRAQCWRETDPRPHRRRSGKPGRRRPGSTPPDGHRRALTHEGGDTRAGTDERPETDPETRRALDAGAWCCSRRRRNAGAGAGAGH